MEGRQPQRSPGRGTVGGIVGDGYCVSIVSCSIERDTVGRFRLVVHLTHERN